MDRATVKLLLESYCPEDADDPIFREALREVASDPELAAWFENMQRLDAVISEKIQGIPVPAEVKDHILLGASKPNNILHNPRSWAWAVPASIAALIAISLFAWHVLTPSASRMTPMELQALAYSKKMPALQFVCFNAAAVAAWVNKQPGAQKVGLTLPVPDQSMSMAMIGSSVVDWNGRPVVMICLQDGKRMAMLYILNAKDFPEMADGATDTMRKEDWVVRATKSNGKVQLLAAQGGPEGLDFKMPY